MKRNNIYLATAAALLALAGCDRALEPSGGAITVEASIGPMTKVQTTGVATTFETGDRIAVYAWTGGADSVPASRTVDGVPNTLGSDGKWTPSAPMLWQNATDAHFFVGVSPVRSISDFTADPFVLDPADYEAGDLLVAANFGTGGAGLKDTGAAVPLTFHHAMARLDVNLRFRSEWTSVPAADQVGVTVTAKSGATVNYLTQAVTAAGSAGAVPMLASAAAGGYHLGFKSIQVPQEGVRRISLTVDGVDYVYEAGEDIPLQSGKFTTLSLVLGKDKLELSDVAVSDWTEIADLPGGEASGTWDLATPLTIEAIEAGAQVTFTFSSVVAENSVQYRTWSGAAWGDWTTYTGGTAITLTNVGDKLQFRGDNASYATSSSNYSSIRFDKYCYVYGNIMSLITSTGYSTATTLTGSYSFFKLFYYNICLKSHATKQLFLPATTLADSCYENMFEECSELTTAPVLPATTLATACYANMFLSCSMLSSPPALPATTLADNCYQGMFANCISLTTVPALPATTLAKYCYFAMFEDCEGLNSTPVLPATTLTECCYERMFAACIHLNRVTCLATDISAFNCTGDWLKNAGKEVIIEGVGIKEVHTPASMDSAWPKNSDSGIPIGWTRVDYVAPVVP